MLKLKEKNGGGGKQNVDGKRRTRILSPNLHPSPFTPTTRATFNGPHTENIRMSQEVLTHRLRSAVVYQCSDSVLDTEHGRPIQSITI